MNAHLGTLAFIAIVILALAAGMWLASCGADSFSCKSVGTDLYECSRGNDRICTRESGEIVPANECDSGETYR